MCIKTPKFKELILIILFILLISPTSFSQNDFREGYYITWKNDTVYGLIDYRGEARNSKVCVYKSNKQAKVKQFSPNDIQGYRYTDSKYYIDRKSVV